MMSSRSRSRLDLRLSRLLAPGAAVLVVTAFFGACTLRQDLGYDVTEPPEAGDWPDADDGIDADGTETDASSDGNDGASIDRDASTEGDAGSFDAASDSATPDTSPDAGGPLGTLPTGYCCTSDEQCRFRRCVAVGNGDKACVDQCDQRHYNSAFFELQDLCAGPQIQFECPEGSNVYCQPPPGFRCIPSNDFHVGTRTTGDCCSDTGDTTTGQECEANLCLASGADPWFCTRRCQTSGDCPKNFICDQIRDHKECLPANLPFKCGN